MIVKSPLQIIKLVYHMIGMQNIFTPRPPSPVELPTANLTNKKVSPQCI